MRPTEGATVLLNGDPEAGVVDIIGTSVRDTLEYAANDVSFEYLSLSGEDAVYTATDDDPSISETRSVVLASGWRVRGEVVQSAANIYLNRFKDARRQYIIDTTLAGVLADVTLGVSVNEPDVGLTVTTSDVTEMSINLLGQTATISTHTDPVAMERYAIVGDATTDPVGSTVGSLDRVW